MQRAGINHQIFLLHKNQQNKRAETYKNPCQFVLVKAAHSTRDGEQQQWYGTQNQILGDALKNLSVSVYHT